MAERKLKVFLCHSSSDKPAVRELYRRLREDGVEPWLDEEDLLLGQEWEPEIVKAVRVADVIVVCLSRGSITREGFVQKEISFALDVAKEKPPGTIFLIPLRLEECELPDRLRGWHAGSLYEERGYERLLRALQNRAGGLGLTVASSQDPPLQKKAELQKIWRDRLGLEFVLIPAGEFLMGAANGEDDEKPVHRVRIIQPFYLGKYPVMQGQWQAVMGNNPSHFTGDLNRPVENVSWDDVQEFLRKLNGQEKGATYHLPTEAEWEYAARAGSTGAYCFGDDLALFGEYAWYYENSGGTTHPVGQLKPNAWGLYDMHGNVWEWVQDWYGTTYYQSSPVDDPQGPERGQYRVLRGGAYFIRLRDARCAYRLRNFPISRYDHLGCRVVGRPKL
jgi:formylglycine-generating enzyme required for sulfatase activity